MTISLIWAMDENGLIGKNNELPWRLPRDFAFFKERTLNRTILMGRKTWDSLGGKPLPRRRNLVLTRDGSFDPAGAEVVHSLEEGLEQGRVPGEELMIIGGSEIYRIFLPYADKLIVTRIDRAFEGDTYFPEVDWTLWKAVKEEPGIQDEQNTYPYRFMEYERLS